METIVKDTAAMFGKNYPKSVSLLPALIFRAYAMSLLKKVEDDAKEGDSTGYELLARPEVHYFTIVSY